MAAENDELIQMVNELRADVRSLSNQFGYFNHELSKISGGLAVVLKRSLDNKNELEATKKKLPNLPQGSTYTRDVLRDWRERRRLPKS